MIGVKQVIKFNRAAIFCVFFFFPFSPFTWYFVTSRLDKGTICDSLASQSLCHSYLSPRLVWLFRFTSPDPSGRSITRFWKNASRRWSCTAAGWTPTSATASGWTWTSPTWLVRAKLLGFPPPSPRFTEKVKRANDARSWSLCHSRGLFDNHCFVRSPPPRDDSD